MGPNIEVASRCCRRRASSGALLTAFLLCVLASFWLVGGPIAEAQEYTIRPGDVLKVTVWGQEDLSKEYPVDGDGFVPFPLVGRVRAGGLTTKMFAAHLTEALEKDYLVNPQVLVSVKEYFFNPPAPRPKQD
jgi:protein involved in polysaccharide export with SLBB domain